MKNIYFLFVSIFFCLSCNKKSLTSEQGSIYYKIEGQNLLYTEKQITSFSEAQDNSWHIEGIKPKLSSSHDYKIDIHVYFGDNNPNDFIGQNLLMYSEFNNLDVPKFDIQITHVFPFDLTSVFSRELESSAMFFKINEISGDRISAEFDGEVFNPQCEFKPGDKENYLVFNGTLDDVLISK